MRPMAPKRKTRPGGQPDGSSYKGAWGGWALATNTASMGRDDRSHTHKSRVGRRTFKASCDFFNFFRRVFSGELSSGGPIRLVDGRFVGRHVVGRHGGSRRIQIPGEGNLLTVRGLFGGTGARERRDPHRPCRGVRRERPPKQRRVR